MTLVERCKGLQADIQRLKELRDRARVAEALQTRQGNVREAKQRLQPLVRTEAVLRRRGAALPGNLAHAFRLREQLGEMLAQQAADITSVESARRVFRELDQLSNALSSALSEAWRAYTSRYVQNLDHELLGVLAAVPGLQAHVSNIRQLESRLQARRSRLPEIDADVDEFHRIVEAIAEVWSTLAGGSLPPSVISFLRAACSSGAQLSTLTAEVVDWLENTRLTSSFCIRTTSSG